MTNALASLGYCGLGLRNEFLEDLLYLNPKPIDFLEVAPENWLDIGGKRGKLFKAYSEQYPIICHGLSLSIGGLQPIDVTFVQRLKQFFQTHKIQFYSEHLSYCSDEYGQLYDLMPMPFTEEAVSYIAKRIIQVQDILEQQIALENVSYYAKMPGRLTEAEFINAVIEEANCLLLLDVNNIYVNSVNHNYDPLIFLQEMPKENIAYFHVAGHWQKSFDLIIDTHGDKVIEPVWSLLDKAYEQFGLVPTLLERDNDVPKLHELLSEVDDLKKIQYAYQKEYQLYGS
ncbi:DUF692 domain-containing protein [Thiotrichales bacterium 19X7-9]|nr:DUF692 domain-containing protein [Thiotrichales bacterium 19X7-9]